MEQIADEILFDLQVALVDVGHPRKRIHVLDHLALGVVFDPAVLVLVGKPSDGREVAAFGDFLAGEIKFLAANPINRPGRLQRFGGQYHRVRPDEADFSVGPL